MKRKNAPAPKFQCSSASRKFLNRAASAGRDDGIAQVSVLFSEPKIPQYQFQSATPRLGVRVSVLFSEPKIPQFVADCVKNLFEQQVSVLFSEPKIPQSSTREYVVIEETQSFSALQRAENSSMEPETQSASVPPRAFQCSSASRKFLNAVGRGRDRGAGQGFSALQRAENSSMDVVE